MGKFKVFIPNKMQSNVVDILSKTVDVDYVPIEEMMPDDDFKKHLAKADGIMIPSRNKINKDVLSRAINLKAVCNIAVGFDNLDLEALTQRGIYATNTPGVLTNTTADLVFGLLVATARRIPEANSFVHEGKWVGWEPSMMLGHDVYGQTLGIIGYGRIGSAIAKRANGFDMNILYNDLHRVKDDELNLGIQYSTVDNLLVQSDFVLIQVPLTNETRLMMSKKQFGKMKSSAIFINASRGEVVDEEALYQALQEKRIAAAGLDTYTEEPINMDNPLLKMKNVVTLPHIGSASVLARSSMEMLAAHNMLQIASGDVPDNLLNKNVLNKHQK